MSGKNKKGPRLPGAKKLQELAEQYFQGCTLEECYPSAAGLALALGFSCRRELEDRAAGDSKGAAALRRALSRIEEANVQAAYRSGSATGAKFILQTGFGYSDKKEPAGPGVIRVNILEEEDG